MCLLYFCARLFIVALWSRAGKGLTSWLSFVMSYCEFVTFELVSWVRCGIVQPVKRDWTVLSKDTPMDISILKAVRQDVFIHL